MTDLFWLKWPVVKDGYKAEGEERTWVVRQDPTGHWRLGTSLHIPPFIPALTSVGIYDTRRDAELRAQQLEDQWSPVALH